MSGRPVIILPMLCRGEQGEPYCPQKEYLPLIEHLLARTTVPNVLVLDYTPFLDKSIGASFRSTLQHAHERTGLDFRQGSGRIDVVAHGCGVQVLSMLAKEGTMFGSVIVLEPHVLRPSGEPGSSALAVLERGWREGLPCLDGACERLEVFVVDPESGELYEANVDGEIDLIENPTPREESLFGVHLNATKERLEGFFERREL